MQRFRLRRIAKAVAHPVGKRKARRETAAPLPHPPVQEKVSGPYADYYFASYVTRLEGGQYLAYCKICLEEPASYWDAAAIEKVSSAGRATPDAALDHAEDLALRWVTYWLNELAE